MALFNVFQAQKYHLKVEIGLEDTGQEQVAMGI